MVDLSKKKESEGEELLKQACDKYSESIDINPHYFMGYYYYGCALHSLGRSVKDKNKQVSIIINSELYIYVLYEQLSENYLLDAKVKLEQANALRTEDVFVLNELASTLHDHALLKESMFSFFWYIYLLT